MCSWHLLRDLVGFPAGYRRSAHALGWKSVNYQRGRERGTDEELHLTEDVKLEAMIVRAMNA